MVREARRKKSAAGSRREQQRLPVARKVPDALELLHADHLAVEELFGQFEKFARAALSPLSSLIARACDELEVHAMLEEQLFYPAVQRALRGRNAVLESQLEHQATAHLIAELRVPELDASRSRAAFRVLIRQTRRHIRKEEQQIFRLVRALPLDLEELGARMQTLRKSLLGQQDIARSPAITGSDAEAAERHSRGELHYRDVARH